jgi:transketolase
MVSKALKAAETLAKEGISLQVVNMSTLKPIDEKAVKELVKNNKGVITAEEHTIMGGLASAIKHILRRSAIPIECIAIQDQFGQSTLDYEQLLEHYGLTAEEIIRAARDLLS